MVDLGHLDPLFSSTTPGDHTVLQIADLVGVPGTTVFGTSTTQARASAPPVTGDWGAPPPYQPAESRPPPWFNAACGW